MCMYTRDVYIQFNFDFWHTIGENMDPILLDIFIIAVNIHVHGPRHGHLELHFNNVHHSNMYMASH